MYWFNNYATATELTGAVKCVAKSGTIIFLRCIVYVKAIRLIKKPYSFLAVISVSHIQQARHGVYVNELTYIQVHKLAARTCS